MRELIFERPGKLSWRDMTAPTIQHPADALVRPIAATTCDLDVMIIRGKTPFQGPFAIGHECIAEVTAVGEGAKGLHVGQLVAVNYFFSCGFCDRCHRNKPNTCRSFPPGKVFGLGDSGGHHGGMFCDLIRVPHAAANLFPLPPKLDPVPLASLADNITFGYEYTVPHLQNDPGAAVLVLGGTGSIGLYAAMFAAAAGGSVDYVDTDRDRLERAAKVGANVIESPPGERRGSYPIVVDTSGSQEGMLCAIRSTEAEGILSSVGGVFADVPFPIFRMYTRGITFYTGRGKGGPNIAAALDWISSGRVRPELIITEVADFDDAAQVLAEPSMKPILRRVPLHASGNA